MKTGRLFRGLKTDLHISRLTQICKDASEKWLFMSKTSGMVEQAFRNNVERNLAFMSKNYNSMTPEEKKDRIDELEQQLKTINRGLGQFCK
ncbi:hypothetical protein DPMN_066227 [Dreissena polymorpha]|uniref:Uncharacterized protein n=1 Tax=Dreissena polymorpha TaxID=45954 RepID=A0A9D3YV19_DREPO|nr:hypothetical protein DPMN_066227 [Dreissena polymorpha]